MAKFYDLFRDTREEYPVSTEVGAWGGQEFVRIFQRHKKSGDTERIVRAGKKKVISLITLDRFESPPARADMF